MADNLVQQIDTACKAAETFTKIFFEGLDTKRHTLNRFYMDNAILVWDGNVYTGKDSIQTFVAGLPMTTHIVQTLDAQPVASEAVKGQQTIQVSTAGFMKQTGGESFDFSQSFVLAALDSKWKIFCHTCRLQRPLPKGSTS